VNKDREREKGREEGGAGGGRRAKEGGGKTAIGRQQRSLSKNPRCHMFMLIYLLGNTLGIQSFSMIRMPCKFV
jgi:hypothetical protein